MWCMAVTSLQRAIEITLSHLRLLLCPFESNSENFYGDLGHVKIAIRKDCSAPETLRLQQLARQVKFIVYFLYIQSLVNFFNVCKKL